MQPRAVLQALGLSVRRMGQTHVSRLLGRQPVGSAQQAASTASDHSQEVADVVLKEGLPHVPGNLKASARRRRPAAAATGSAACRCLHPC